MSDTLVIELGTEELPPGALRSLSEAFAAGIAEGLRDANLPIGEVQPLASPRRLAVQITDVADKAPDHAEERLGPAVAAAFDDNGNPTKAAEGFARSCGVDVSALEQQETDKGTRLCYRGTAVGRSLAELLPAVFAEAVKRLPIPKRMRWGEHQEAFVRPVHWLMAMHGRSILPLEAFGCSAGDTTHGHRFHHPGPIALDHADSYVARLENPGYVLVDMDQRIRWVESGVSAAARKAGGQALFDDGLVAEVTALVEWPVALAGRFDSQYLALPREVLIATLEGHQRYFPVIDATGELAPSFVTVANIQSRDPERVVAGNERVIRPRLADALFFWQRDQARGLDAFVSGLGRVMFQRDLGSLADKGTRVARIADWLAKTAGVDATAVARACTLAKADLLTEMVDEFPELQGTMGCYYARAAGEHETVALALDEQYAPRQAHSAVAQTSVGRILAIADRLDSLAGVFAIGGRPSGEKDPFALRRAALAVLRTLIESGLDLDLRAALAFAADLQPVGADQQPVVAELLTFHLDRLRAYYADRGFPTEVFDAVATNGLTRPLDFDSRIHAVRGFLELPSAVQLCGAHKRIRNILKEGVPAGEVDAQLLSEPAEQALNDTLETLQQQAFADYSQALTQLATLQQPVDRFFSEVRVMSKDIQTRQNRLALLGALDTVCRSVADISRLMPTEREAA